MNSSAKSEGDLVDETCLNIPYIEMMFPSSEQAPMYMDSQAFEINQVHIPSDTLSLESKNNEMSEAKSVEGRNSHLPNKTKDFSEKSEMKLPHHSLEQQKVNVLCVEEGSTGANIMETAQSSCSKQMEEVTNHHEEHVNGQKIITDRANLSEESANVKTFSRIHASGTENCLPNDDRTPTEDNKKVEDPPDINISQDNFQNFITKEEEGQTKHYLGPFTMKQKIQVFDLEHNKVKAVEPVDGICNGLIIEIYHHWMKQNYKISRLCDWIRSLCPQNLNLTDSSLYVKVKNLIKMKHKQIIRSKTKKFEGCFEKFQSGPFFKLENFLNEDLSNETPKEKLLRLELKKSQKVINRQEKEIARKNSVIQSISYDLEKLTEELNALRELNKSVKKENRSLLEKKTADSSEEEESKESGKEKTQRGDGTESSDVEGNKKAKGRSRNSRDKRKSQLLEIEDYFSLSWTQNGDGVSGSHDSPVSQVEDEKQNSRSRRAGKGKEIRSDNRKRKLDELNVDNSPVSPSQYHGFDKHVKIKLEPVTVSEAVLY